MLYLFRQILQIQKTDTGQGACEVSDQNLHRYFTFPELFELIFNKILYPAKNIASQFVEQSEVRCLIFRKTSS